MRLSYALALGALTTTASAVDLEMTNDDIGKVWRKVNTLRESMIAFEEAHGLFDNASAFDRNSVRM